MLSLWRPVTGLSSSPCLCRSSQGQAAPCFQYLACSLLASCFTIEKEEPAQTNSRKTRAFRKDMQLSPRAQGDEGMAGGWRPGPTSPHSICLCSVLCCLLSPILPCHACHSLQTGFPGAVCMQQKWPSRLAPHAPSALVPKTNESLSPSSKPVGERI